MKSSLHIKSVDFRNKNKGWKNFGFKLKCDGKDKTESILTPFYQNPYMKAFLQDVILRPSCYECKAKECSSQSDMTIADFWGINTVFPDMDDDKGTSLVFINTDKGKTAFDFSQTKVAETTYERIKPLNPACYRSPKVNPRRKKFFAQLGKENLMELINYCTEPTMVQKIKIFPSRCKSILKRIIKGVIGR